MSELISGKEAWILKSDGQEIQYNLGGMGWCDLSDKEFNYWSSDRFLNESLNYKFRIKPKTTLLNGIEVGQLVSSQWSRDEPNKVKLEFNNPEDANYFRSKALDIFNHNNG